jgi:hypothetical protein
MGKGMCLNSINLDRLWNHIWNIQGTCVVKMFLWKACNDILPTKQNLAKKGVVTKPYCHGD